MDRYGSSARGRSYEDEYDTYSEDDHHGRSARGPSYSSEYDTYSEEDRYGRTPRGRDNGHLHGGGYDSYTRDDALSDDDLGSSRHPRHAVPSSRRGDRRGAVDLGRPPRQSMGREESEDDLGHTSSRSMGGTTSSYGHARRPRGYEGTSSDRTYPGEDSHRSERNRDGRTDDRAGRQYNERMHNHAGHGGRAAEESSCYGDSASEVFSDEESGYGRGASGHHGSSSTDFSSRYGSTGPPDHSRGPRRTGGRVDYDDDSESEGGYRHRGGRY